MGRIIRRRGEKRGAHWFSAEKLERKTTLGGSRRKRQNNNKMIIRELVRVT
jgi:hypothetical protein